MKQVLFFFGFFIVLLQACGSDSNTAPSESDVETYPSTIDSAKIKSTDTLVFEQGKLWSTSSMVTIPMNTRDTLKYTEENGKPVRISAMFFTDSTTTWLTAHYKGDDLILTRFRRFALKPVPNSLEAICYIENGKIYHSIERARNISEGGQIGEFRLEPYKTNNRTPAQLKAEYEPFLEAATKTISERNSKQ